MVHVFLSLLKASNLGALSLYTKLGFVKEEKMAKYYLNGGDAYRLKLWIDKGLPAEDTNRIADSSELELESKNLIASSQTLSIA